MHRAASTSRFLIDLSSGGHFVDSENLAERDGLLHQVVVSRLARTSNSLLLLNELADCLIRSAEHALSLREMGALEEVSLALMNLPVAYARQIGQYYQALVINRNGHKHQALSLLEGVAVLAPLHYRGRALQSLSAVHHELGQPDEALRFYPDALRMASSNNRRDLLTTLFVDLEMAWYKSETGDHRGSLADYQKLSPLVRIVARQHPLYFYLYHNELAIEFAELGRLAEAEAACAIALASPYAPAYPEWSATRDEIAAKRQTASQSVVAIHRAPEAERAPLAKPQRNAKPALRFVSGYQASAKDFFQRSKLPIPARTTTTAFNKVSILDRVLICIGPRAPPARS